MRILDTTRAQRAQRLAWWVGATPALCALALVLQVVPGAGEWLEYRPDCVAVGQAWRVLTCHFVHWNTSHLVWDALMFVVLGCWCERLDRRATWRAMFAGAIVIPLVVSMLHPELRAYRGLSGLDSVLLVWLAVRLLTGERVERGLRWAAGLVLVGFVLKVGYEELYGQTVFARAGAAFVPFAAGAHRRGSRGAAVFDQMVHRGGACSLRGTGSVNAA